MFFRFNRLTLLANIVSLQFTEMSEYQPSSSFFLTQDGGPNNRWEYPLVPPKSACTAGYVCPTTKMSSATVKSSMEREEMGIIREIRSEIVNYLKSKHKESTWQDWQCYHRITIVEGNDNVALKRTVGIKICITTATNRWECRIFSRPGSVEILEYKIKTEHWSQRRIWPKLNKTE